MFWFWKDQTEKAQVLETGARKSGGNQWVSSERSRNLD